MKWLYNRLGAWSDRIVLRGLDSAEALPDDFLPLLRKHQLAAITSLTPLVMFANLVNVSSYVLLEARAGHLNSVDMAWVVLVLLMIARAAYRHRFVHQRQKRHTASVGSIGKLVVFSMLLGLVWTYPLLKFVSHNSLEEIGFIGALTSGIIAAGGLALYPVPLAALAYVAVFAVAVPPAIFIGLPALAVPFLLITCSFFLMITAALHRQLRIFAHEYAQKLRAESQISLLDLLIGNDHERHDNCIWQTRGNLDLVTSDVPVRRILGVDAMPGHPRNLSALLELSRLGGVTDADRCTLAQLSRRNAAPPESFCFRVGDEGGVSRPRTLEIGGRCATLEGREGVYFNGYIKDVTDEAAAMAEVQRLASHDAMTGLPNYREFLTRVAALCGGAQAGASNSQLGVFFVDADNLKWSNDTFGYAMGDALLTTMACRLASFAGATGVTCRKGGDEFLFAGLFPSRRAFERRGAEMQAVLNESFVHDGRVFGLTCTLGASCGPVGGKEIAELLREAELALRANKAKRRGQVGFFSEGLAQRKRRSMGLAEDLRAALRDGGIELEFQPIVSGGDHRIRAMESLLRWRHPVLGPVNPREVIELGTSEGLLGEIGEYVLHRSIELAADWPAEIAVSVNICPWEFERPDFAERVLAELLGRSMPTARLFIEITDSESLSQSRTVLDNIARLREAGVTVALDDFGSCYACIASLARSDCDIIKLDRSLIRDCESHATARSIIHSLVETAQADGRAVVAGGIETEGQLRVLERAGVDYLQGYFLHLPQRADEVVRLLRDSDRGAEVLRLGQAMQGAREGGVVG
ncbi:GGDEF domain-containing protein [Salipiger sp. HF18]|uniref:putative bifunctional diguanylate cyclase/phosphodiesterase n=1 Tax=Salipiger sp. HF18 TaxID=2721557 RepID=UPI00142DC0E3|nr:GGDEF domain-containing protein [Salipiger sp. HF18]NIY95832.1 GGDEF domain-containing protein [Salipiger sp. HF18]